MPLELTFLGSGTSAGVPMIGCGCCVCRSQDPRDRRDRASVLVRWPDASLHIEAEHEVYHPAQAGVRQVLIDTSPELRHQAVRAGLSRLDAVMYTHAHADHVLGLDDLRRFNAAMGGPLEVYAEPRVLESLQSMYPYIFRPAGNINPSFVATLLPFPIHVSDTIRLHGSAWTPVRLMHGRLPIVGYRVEHGGASLAYCTDVSSVPPETWPLLEGLDVLILDALRYRHHPTHLSVEQALEIIDRVRPGRAYLTHIAHDISHSDLESRLPEGVELAWDGLVVEVA